MEYRGGWSNGSTSKFYKEDNIALSIPAMNAIGGWTDIKKNKLPPTLECLGSHAMDQVEAFIEALYMVDIDLFKRNGRLRPLLRACTASLLMYFDDVKRDHGVQATIVKQLIDAAIEANISEVGVSDPKAVLSAWGKTIKEKFIADNFESPLLPSNEQRMDWDHQVNHALVAQNQQLTDDKQHLCSEVADLRDDKKHLRSQVDHLEGKNERLEGENERLESERERLEGEIERLQNLVSSEPDKARVSLSPNRATVGSLPLLSTKAAAAASSTAVVGTQQLASAPAIAAATKKRAAPLNAFDMMTKRPAIHESAVSSSTESLAGVSISRLIAKLYETKGVFQGSKPNLQSRWHKPYKNQGKQEACLELADLVCTPQQWQLLCTPDCNRNQLGAMLIELEQASMTRLMHLEGKATCGASSYIQGVARRISAYKKAKLVSWLPRDVPTPPDASVTDAVVANDEESE